MAVIVGISESTVPASHVRAVTTAADSYSSPAVASDNGMQTRDARYEAVTKKQQVMSAIRCEKRIRMPDKALILADCTQRDAPAKREA